MTLPKLEPLNIDSFGDYYVQAMSETYVISFGSDESFWKWAGISGENYLQKLKTHSESENNFCRTLILDSKPVGMIDAYCSSSGMAYLSFFYISTEYRKQKIGAYLMSEFISWCRNSAITRATLTVEERNVSAIEFYERLGWRNEGRSSKSPTSQILRWSRTYE